MHKAGNAPPLPTDETLADPAPALPIAEPTHLSHEEDDFLPRPERITEGEHL